MNPSEIVGDPPRNRKDAMRSVFNPHCLVPSIKSAYGNNLVERLDGSQRNRTKTMSR